MTNPTDGKDLARSWARGHGRVPRLILRPLHAFLETEQAGGILILVAAAIALVWANSPLRGAYEDLWHSTLTLRLGPFQISEDLRHWVNDALMAVFFFVVGLEIKRELTTGELRQVRVALLPAVAALGGMVVPALIYVSLNTGENVRGWGIPMATDIAFALGILLIFGRGLPTGATSFLLTLAIIDDIGAIAVIAVFYSDHIKLVAILVAAALVLAIVVLRRLGVRASPVYWVLGIGVWFATLESGVHATIAGVVLGLVTPAVPFQRASSVSAEARRIADETHDSPDPPDADAHMWLELSVLSREAVSPLARVEHNLHPWTSYLIVPIFALANAGVPLNASALASAARSRVAWGVLLGLLLGKFVGVTAASWLAVRARIARLPSGVGWRHMLALATLAGIGFTVSLFVTGLAFDDARTQDAARTAVLAASGIAGVAGALLLRRSRSAWQAEVDGDVPEE